MPDVAWSGRVHYLVDVAERPIDLSTQSAANSKTLSDVTAGHVYSASDAISACHVSRFSPVSNSMPQQSLTLPTVCCSGRILPVNSLARDSAHEVFTVASSSVNQSTVTADVPANFSTSVKLDASSRAVESSKEKFCDDGSVSESDGSVKYPKTKKQKAVDGRVSSLTGSLSEGRISEYEALTFGEIQERLITRVVESGSLSDALRDERQLTNKHHLTGILTGKLPTGQIAHFEASQNRPCLPVEVMSSEQCNVQKACNSTVTSAASFPTKQLSFASSTRGLWTGFCFLCTGNMIWALSFSCQIYV